MAMSISSWLTSGVFATPLIMKLDALMMFHHGAQQPMVVLSNMAFASLATNWSKSPNCDLLMMLVKSSPAITGVASLMYIVAILIW